MGILTLVLTSIIFFFITTNIIRIYNKNIETTDIISFFNPNYSLPTLPSGPHPKFFVLKNLFIKLQQIYGYGLTFESSIDKKVRQGLKLKKYMKVSSSCFIKVIARERVYSPLATTAKFKNLSSPLPLRARSPHIWVP